MNDQKQWYEKYPYMDQDTHIIDGFGTVTYFSFNIPRIIEKEKEREREREFHINCRNCGASTSFSPNDLNPHQQVDNE